MANKCPLKEKVSKKKSVNLHWQLILSYFRCKEKGQNIR